MLKKSAARRIVISSLSLLFLLIIYSFPENAISVHNETESYIEAIKMPIYILDENKYVSRVNILKKSEDIESNIKYIINNLTIDSTESGYLSDSFMPVIPSGTKLISYDLENKVLKLNFSSEFLNVSLENEEKMIESIIFSLCEFEEIEDIMIFVDTVRLDKLPNSLKTLPILLNKNYGINKLYDLTSFKNVTQTINYYMAKNNDETYFVPVSMFGNHDNERVVVIINNLKTSPINQTNLLSYLKVSANIESYEILEESISISFDNNAIADLHDNEVLEEVKYSIYLSIRDTYDVKSVMFDIGDSTLVSVITN